MCRSRLVLVLILCSVIFLCVNIIVLLIVIVILDLIGGSAQTGNLSVLKCVSIGV